MEFNYSTIGVTIVQDDDKYVILGSNKLIPWDNLCYTMIFTIRHIAIQLSHIYLIFSHKINVKGLQ